MSLSLVSDLHLEFLRSTRLVPEEMKPDPAGSPLLVVAGDLCAASDLFYRDKLADVTRGFRMCLYVPGNHEYYNPSLSKTMSEIDRHIAETCADVSNVITMQKRTVVIGDTAFLGCTLWTNLSSAFWEQRWAINDFRLICGEARGVPMTPRDFSELHADHAGWLRSEIARLKKKREVAKAVVITHHSPDIMLSKDCSSRRADLRPFYYSTDMRDLVEDPFIRAWCYGHTHESHVFRSEKTIFATNAVGYGHEVTGFTRTGILKF